MKSIIFKEVQYRKYYLGHFDEKSLFLSEINTNKPPSELEIEHGCGIFTKIERKEYIEIARTEKLDKLKNGDYINIDNEDVKINKVSYDLEGNVLYYINKIDCIYDNKSKIVAENELREREKVIEEIKEKTLKKSKTWYKFWKTPT